MKVLLRPIRAYEILTQDRRRIADMTVEANWEGMLKLRGPKGVTVIVEEPGAMQEITSLALQSFGTDGTIECDVVKASPDLMAQLIGMSLPAAQSGSAASEVA